MDIAASVVAFVGISGQILQGCNYLSTFFSDVRDAPDVFVAISSELSTLRGRLEGFQLLLREMQVISPPSLIVQQDPEAALQRCQDAVQKLEKFVNKYAALSIPAGAQSGSSQTSTDIVRKTWYKLAVARKSDKLRHHRSQLEAAKASLLGAQANILQALQLQHLNVSTEVQRDLRQFQETQDASAQVMRETRALATNTYTLQEEHRVLSTRTKASMDQVVAYNQILLTRTALSEQAAHEARATTNLTQETVTSLSIDLVNRFENLPTVLAPIIENSIAQCLAKHDALGSTATPSKGKASKSRKVCEGDSCNEDTYSLPVRTTSDTPLPQCEGPSSELSSDLPHERKRLPLEVGSFLPPERLSKRSPKRRRTNTSTYNLWFAQLAITTSQTEQEDEPGSDYLPPLHLQAKGTTLKLIPSSWFLRVGFLYESGHSLPTISHPGWDNRMRVFRTHPYQSPVVKAIYNADLLHFRQLLERREITPFDRIVHPNEDFMRSLFEHVTYAFGTTFRSSNASSLEKQKRHLDIARLLADSGVDCGSDESLYFFVTFMSSEVEEADEAATDPYMSLFRIIIAHSESDPFYGLGKSISYPHVCQSSVIVKQDVWDVSESKNIYNQSWGPGSFQNIVENGANHHYWLELQKQRWRDEPASLRSSKSHCMAEYGEEFVLSYWPELCWSEEKPTFWKSRETCEETFGKRFVEFTWPYLYWREELPSFWHSREACQEAFGSRFVECHWPELHWRQELPPFWHSRNTCLELFRGYFVERQWPKWLGQSRYEFLEGKGSWQRSRDYAEVDWERERWLDKNKDCWREDNAASAIRDSTALTGTAPTPSRNNYPPS